MVHNDASPLQVILYEGNGSAPLQEEARFEVFMSLLDQGYSVKRVTQGGNGMAHASSPLQNRLLVLGNFAGNAPNIEDAAGQVDLEARDISEMDAAAVLALVEQFRDDQPMNQPPAAGGKSWKPWFPVIDYDRCTNCMQCLSFCLFDVYGIDDEQKIQVQNQDNCKTNCPACSRVCPEVAIMFPKYSSGPINGAPVSEKDVNREKMKVDISSLLGGDIYSSLRQRSEEAKSRFSKERSPDKALNERKKCLTKLQSDGIIPAEVLAELDLASLPSPEEIQQKAKEAAAKAQAALDAQKQ